MTYQSIWNELLPVVAFLLIGYSLARYLKMSAGHLETVLRYVFLPVVIYTQLEARLQFKAFMMVGLVGAGMAILCGILVRQAPRFLAPKVDMSAAIPNIATFLIPFLILSYGKKGVGTACAFYIGAILALHILESRKNLSVLFKEPWFYAFIVALISQGVRYSSSVVDSVMDPLLLASSPLFLIFLGASLHPLESLKDIDAWVTAGVRLVGGFGIGLVALLILRGTSSGIREGVMLASIAPPTTKLLSLAEVGGSGSSSKAAATVGTVLFLIVMVILMRTGWEPWDLFLN